MNYSDPTLLARVNDVQAKQDQIIKVYHSHLKKYDTHWPLTRAQVEVDMIHLLSSLQDDQIQFPKIIAWQPKTTTLTMKRLSGRPLSQFQAKDLMDEQLWKPLFSFFEDLKNITKQDLRQATGSYFSYQTKIQKCMYQNKIEQQPPLGKQMLCLGDVSIYNVLWDTKKPALVDLECAHWGYPGYDIGQLLAMLQVRFAHTPLLPYLDAHMSQWIQDPLFYQQIIEWKQAFLPYYKSQK
ncbi:phosphotransferase [Absicoccus intestinalis]|uniref:Aminoglycoside phosphotransferase family protein n=1 Tax=Absicoccus intestinalis TaxID=2926319 RepID=A0ABU4WJ05_9FIRM|nr:phosphotransferase [Absicoccus sp. CLA-KB-P134]MDX8416258.1 aminoglycoside phosphotransferase family protein [Absicoccus sp. CLA-KB-P134]